VLNADWTYVDVDALVEGIMDRPGGGTVRDLS